MSINTQMEKEDMVYGNNEYIVAIKGEPALPFCSNMMTQIILCLVKSVRRKTNTTDIIHGIQNTANLVNIAAQTYR